MWVSLKRTATGWFITTAIQKAIATYLLTTVYVGMTMVTDIRRAFRPGIFEAVQAGERPRDLRR